MLLGGDEFARSQRGNNNAYCQDNEISWVNWVLDDDARALQAFTRRLLALRRACPTLCRSRFLTGTADEEFGVRDLTWINANGGEMQEAHWNDASTKCLGMLIDGRAQKTGIHKAAADPTVLLVLNGYQDVVDFTLPKSTAGPAWTLQIDTNLEQVPARAPFKPGTIYQVTGRSLLLFTMGGAG
jgi:isoamylase